MYGSQRKMVGEILKTLKNLDSAVQNASVALLTDDARTARVNIAFAVEHAGKLAHAVSFLHGMELRQETERKAKTKEPAKFQPGDRVLVCFDGETPVAGTITDAPKTARGKSYYVEFDQKHARWGTGERVEEQDLKSPSKAVRAGK